MTRRPLRIVFVGTLPEPGGAASHLISLSTALAAAGHTVAVVTHPNCGIRRALEQNDQIALYSAAFTTRFDRSAMRTLEQAIVDVKPDRVYAVFEQDYWGVLRMAERCKVMASLFAHHAGLTRFNRLVMPLLPRRFLVPSEDLRQWLVARHVPEHRTRVLHNPVDTAHWQVSPRMRAEQRAALGFAPDDVVVGYVGRFEKNKGVVPFAHALTQAMARSANLRALWVGFGTREGEVDEIINGSPFADRHVRRPWSDDPLTYYAAMDMLALPSTGRESFGRVLVEAQSCQLPVLGSDRGGIGETMDVNVSGRLVAPGDVDAWANALVDLAGDATARSRMGKAGREYVIRKFDSAVVVRELEALLYPEISD